MREKRGYGSCFASLAILAISFGKAARVLADERGRESLTSNASEISAPQSKTADQHKIPDSTSEIPVRITPLQLCGSFAHSGYGFFLPFETLFLLAEASAALDDPAELLIKFGAALKCSALIVMRKHPTL